MRGAVSHGGASARLVYSRGLPSSMRGLWREVTGLKTRDEDQGKGHAAALLADLIARSDEAGIGLLLIADTPELAAMYARRGFLQIVDAPLVMMARAPRERRRG